jgi:hypothetical protein
MASSCAMVGDTKDAQQSLPNPEEIRCPSVSPTLLNVRTRRFARQLETLNIPPFLIPGPPLPWDKPQLLKFHSVDARPRPPNTSHMPKVSTETPPNTNKPVTEFCVRRSLISVFREAAARFAGSILNTRSTQYDAGPRQIQTEKKRQTLQRDFAGGCAWL